MIKKPFCVFLYIFTVWIHYHERACAHCDDYGSHQQFPSACVRIFLAASCSPLSESAGKGDGEASGEC